MIHHISKTDSSSFSTKDTLDSNDFPTTYFSAACVAELMSTSLSFLGYRAGNLGSHSPFCQASGLRTWVLALHALVVFQGWELGFLLCSWLELGTWVPAPQHALG